MSTCTIRTEFLGVELPACGEPATVEVYGHCERGHERTRVVCRQHAGAFALMPSGVVCEQCTEAGHDGVPMTLGIGRTGGDR